MGIALIIHSPSLFIFQFKGLEPQFTPHYLFSSAPYQKGLILSVCLLSIKKEEETSPPEGISLFTRQAIA